MSRIVIVAVLMFAAVAAVNAQGLSAAKVEVISLSASKSTPTELKDFSYECTNCRLLVKIPGKHITDVFVGDSKLTSFSDDKGNDLTKENTQSVFNKEQWFNENSIVVSENGAGCALSISAPNRPAAGTQKIKIQASITFLCGKKEKSLEVKDVVLDEKLALQIGEFTMIKVKPLVAGYPIDVIVRSSDAFKRIKSISFLTASGKEINSIKMDDSSIYSSSILSGGLSWTCQAHYAITEGVDRCTVRLTYFEELESITVPVDIEVGLGL